MTPVTLYMRPGCHLCEDAASLLLRLGCEVDEVNIEESAELLLRYSFTVPVLAINGTEVLSGVIREREARAALARHGRRSS